MMKTSLKYFLLITSVGLFASTQVQSVESTDYSDALAYGSHRYRQSGSYRGRNTYRTSTARTRAPYRMEDTGNPEISEKDMIVQLNSRSRQVFNSMSEEGRALALELAGDRYRYDKNEAVMAAAEVMQERRFQQKGQQQQKMGMENTKTKGK